jgi:hypothetical protein
MALQLLRGLSVFDRSRVGHILTTQAAAQIEFRHPKINLNNTGDVGVNS